MNQQGVQTTKEQIEKIYGEYVEKVIEAKAEQDEILKEFVCELEKAKMEEIRNKISRG